MKTYKLSKRSLDRLQGVHPDLVAVVKLAITRTSEDFTVLEGVRSEARQRELYNSGASKTMNSRHLTGHAVDIAPLVNNTVSWHWPHYYPLAETMKKCADELGVQIEWGGDWRTFKDGPHWQLPWPEYDRSDFTPRHKVRDLELIDPYGPNNPPVDAPLAPPRTPPTTQNPLIALLTAFLGLFRRK